LSQGKSAVSEVAIYDAGCHRDVSLGLPRICFWLAPVSLDASPML
jgi:hypothetical protein